MGDDILDISCMEWSGASACPIDAIPEVKAISQYICNNEGRKRLCERSDRNNFKTSKTNG
jgi:3-deoxy-D-manno-octulosonate 8-phosphate phosphatase KdsC-like HAD superfamily phosphatase